MIKKTLTKKKKEFSIDEIDSFFEKLNSGERTFPVIPTPEVKDTTSGWVTTSGSSNQSNKLIKISAWQTGQAY